MKNIIKTSHICNRLKNHPQVRRLLQRIPLNVIYNGQTVFNPLKPDPLAPMPGFENIEPIELPDSLEIKGHDGELLTVDMRNDKYSRGVLKLNTSEVAMDHGNRYEELNRIDIIGEMGVIGSYSMHEIPGNGYSPQLSFIYGECECPSLEDPESDSVQNDRAKLVENEKTKALLAWIGENVRDLAQKIAEKERSEQQDIQEQMSSLYNNFLDDWKNKFMSRVFSTILVGPGDGKGGGNGTGGSLGPIGAGHGNGKRNGGGEGDNPGGGNKEKKGNKFPRILLSGFDPDPLSTEGLKLILNPRQGAVYQRPRDVEEGIYWINTSSPLATAILEKFNANHPRWRDYLLQRYIDIFTQETLEKLEKRDPDLFNFATINRKMSEVVTKAQEAASKDLKSFLFEDNFNPNQGS